MLDRARLAFLCFYYFISSVSICALVYFVGSVNWVARIRYGSSAEMMDAMMVAAHINMPNSSMPYQMSPFSAFLPIAVFIGDSIGVHLRGVPPTQSIASIARIVEDVGTVLFIKELPPVGDCRFGAMLLIIFHQQRVSSAFCFLIFHFPYLKFA